MSKIIKKDPENYRKLSEPFPNDEAANKALEDFYEELGELRKKHKIRDLLVTVYASVLASDGTEAEFLNSMSYGSSVNSLPMAAYVYGVQKKEHSELMGKLLTGNK